MRATYFALFSSSSTFLVIFQLLLENPSQVECLKNEDRAERLKTLQQVQIIFRHGERNPLGPTFPADLYNNESSWEDGWGALTKYLYFRHNLLYFTVLLSYILYIVKNICIVFMNVLQFTFELN